jgi:hypothetical protein
LSPDVKTKVNSDSELPDEKYANWWNIKCGTMYDKCTNDKCGLTIRLGKTRKYYDFADYQRQYRQHRADSYMPDYTCDMVWKSITTMVKIGVLNVPDSGSFTMPSHGKLVEGFVTRLSDDKLCLSEWCTNNKKQEFLQEVDAAVREGLAKARFKIAKRIQKKIATLTCTAGANGQACQNGGSASGTTGSCGCSCVTGYEGANCQTAKACTAGANGQACQNGGSASGTTGSCGCSCATGYEGANCQTASSSSSVRTRRRRRNLLSITRRRRRRI